MCDLKTFFFPFMLCLEKKEQNLPDTLTFFLLYVSKQHRMKEMLTLWQVFDDNINTSKKKISQCHHLNVCCQDFTKLKQLVIDLLLSLSYHSCWTNGLAIASIPSAGQMRTTEVPLHTTNPRVLVSSVNLYGSSGSEKKEDRICNQLIQDFFGPLSIYVGHLDLKKL